MKSIRIGICLIIIGLITTFIGALNMNFNFSTLNTNKYVNREYVIDENFTDISIDAITSQIKLVKSSDDKTKIEVYEREEYSSNYSVQDGTLKITQKHNKKWYDFLGIFLKKQTITIYLANENYSKLEISNTTGDILIPDNFTFNSANIKTTTGDVSCKANISGNIKITLTTGDVNLKNAVQCESLFIKSTTGDVNLENVVATTSITINLTTGDVKFSKCDGNSISIKSTTGDIVGSFKTSKIITAKTTTGKINVQNSTEGGLCDLSTTTGNITITILN